jgi:hypothetical protein
MNRVDPTAWSSAALNHVRIGCHTFRATGIMAYLEAGGTLDNAQLMAARECPRTTPSQRGSAWLSKETPMYAAIRQGKAKAGMAEELARRIKEEAIPIISDVSGFRAYYVIYAPDDTVTAVSIFDDHAGAEESNRRALAWIEQSVAPLLTGSATAVAGPVIVHALA